MLVVLSRRHEVRSYVRVAYQVAHDDLGFTTNSRSTWYCSSGTSSKDSRALLDPTHGCCNSCSVSPRWVRRTTATSTATSGLTPSAEDLIERLVKLSRHFGGLFGNVILNKVAGESD